MRRAEEKLTEAEVRKLFEYQAQGWSLSQLGARFGISRSAAGEALRNPKWAYLKKETA